jgi:purine-cytosine permease-like protein
MADDEDVRGAPGAEDLLAPSGPRRSSFTPAPNDAESLEAAANVFNDDAIAAALSAELARVASGPIPVQRPVVSETTAPVVPEPTAPAVPATAAAVDPEPPSKPTADSRPAPEWRSAPAPSAADLTAADPAVTVPEASEPEFKYEPGPEPEEPEPESQPSPAPVARPAAAPQGPPDWATPLFGQPAVSENQQAAPTSDPFAPSAPSFAPSNGPFPPPGDLPPEPSESGFGVPPAFDASAPQAAPSVDADALRALYSAAPAPTVPAADAPPPPGYETGSPTPQSAAPDPVPASDSSDPAGSDTLSAIEELQAHLDQRDREAREYAAWESSMVDVGTPEALAAVDDARFERADVPSVPSAPVPPPTPASHEPSAFLPPPAEGPVASYPSPVDDPVLPPPGEEPVAFLPPPTAEPAADLAPPAAGPIFDTSRSGTEPAFDLAPPADEPAAFLPPPPVDEPAAFSFPPPTDVPVDSLPPAEANPFDIFASTIDAPSPPAPADDATPFPGFSPPTNSSTLDFSAPADPHELSFESAPDPAPVPETPIFLEPVSPAAPPEEAAAPVPEPDLFEPDLSDPALPEPPALVEPPAPDGVADLWSAASNDSVAPPPPAPGPASEPPAWDVPPTVPGSAESASEQAVAAADFSVPPPANSPPAAPPPVSHGFDDLLTGSADPGPQVSGLAWGPADPEPPAEPAIDAGPEEKHPFGEGVDRDEAVDPSDSIFGPPDAAVRVTTAGVAIAPEYVVVESPPVGVLQPPDEKETPTLVAAPIFPAEKAGLEPTPLEQRAGRSARLFWLWFAANSSIAAVVFGTLIFALGVSLRQAIVATLAGVALSFIPLGLGTLAGKRNGQPTMVISRATFGVVGNILPALISLFSRLFWAAALLWVLGAGTANILVGARLTDGFTSSQLTLAVMAIGFVLAVVIAYFGYALIAVVQLVISVVSGIAIVGFIALTFKYINLTAALSVPDGSWVLVITGAVLVFSFVGLAWANSGADVARYQRGGSSGAASMLWATFGAALPSFVLIGYGVLLAASNARLAANIAANPLDSLGRLLPIWYPAPLLLATALSLLSGVVLSIYSGGFALQAAGLQLRRSLSTLIVGVLMLLIAVIMANALTDFTQLFRDFATTVAVPVAAWAGLFGSEIMIRRRRFDSSSLLARGGAYVDARWSNLVALVAISAVGFGFLSATMPGLSWEGYLFSALGVPLHSQLAGTDLGVLVALALGLLFPLLAGRSAIRAQENATVVPK